MFKYLLKIIKNTNFKIQCAMDYERIIDSVGSKEFWNKFSGLKASLISALENADTGEEQCNLPVVSGSALDVAKQIPQVLQTQIALNSQLEILRIAANKLGLYDAADFIKRN